MFDGHDGSRAANFAAQRMPAELLLGQLLEKTTDEDIKDVLNQVRRHNLSFNLLLWNRYLYDISNTYVYSGILFINIYQQKYL